MLRLRLMGLNRLLIYLKKYYNFFFISKDSICKVKKSESNFMWYQTSDNLCFLPVVVFLAFLCCSPVSRKKKLWNTYNVYNTLEYLENNLVIDCDSLHSLILCPLDRAVCFRQILLWQRNQNYRPKGDYRYFFCCSP